MTGGDGKLHIVVLEPQNVEEIMKGHPAISPDRAVMVCYAPDVDWLSRELAKTDGDAQQIAKLIEQAATRPEKRRTGNEPLFQVVFDKTKGA